MNLKRWNQIAAGLHLVQAAVMFTLIEGAEFDLYVTRLEFDPTVEALTPTIDFLDIELQVGLLLVAFLAMSGVAHTLIATVLYDKYRAYLDQGMNPYRWYEYALSASTMIVAIGALAGVLDIGTLLAMFVLTALMNLMGLMMERQNDVSSGRLTWRDWRPFKYGTVAGAIPWVIIGLAIGKAWVEATDFPTFVLGATGVTFLLFNIFAVNMWLQYKRVGPWKDYLFGERVYIILSLSAKSILAWWVYFGAQGSPTIVV